MINPLHKALLFFLLFSSSCCYSRQVQIDSLKKVLLSAKEDTNKVNALNSVSGLFYLSGNYDTSLLYATQAKSLAEKITFKKGLSSAYNNIGNIYGDQGNTSEALQNFMECLKLREETLPNGIQVGTKQSISNAYSKVGLVYEREGNYPEALKNYLASLKISEETNDKPGLGTAYNNIGNVYSHQGNDADALKNYFTALKIRKETSDKEATAGTYNNIANIYINNGNYAEALKNLLAGLKLFEEIGNPWGVAGCYSNIGIVYRKQGNFNEALKNQFAALKLMKELKSVPGEGYTMGNIGADYADLKNYKEAETYCLKALAIATQIGDLESIKDINQNLSDVYFATARPKQALESYKAYISARGSLLNEENTKKTVRLEMNYEFDKKEAAAKLDQEKKEAVAAAESKKQKIIIWSVCGILLLVFSFAVFAYRSYLQKQKANIEITKQKEIIEEKQKEILDSIYYARRIQRSLMSNENYIQKNLKRLMQNV